MHPIKGFWIIQSSIVKATIQTPNIQIREGFIFMLTDQNPSSNIYFHIVNVNILFCLQDKWVRYSHCTNQGQTQPFKVSFGRVTLEAICASMEIHNEAGDRRHF